MASCLTKQEVDLKEVVINCLEEEDEVTVLSDEFLTVMFGRKSIQELIEEKGISTEDGEVSEALNSLIAGGKIKLCVYDTRISVYLTGGNRDRHGVSCLVGSLLD